jgi:hypothetical protein
MSRSDFGWWCARPTDKSVSICEGRRAIMLVLSVDIAAMSLFMDKEMGMHEERPMAVASLLTGLSLRRRTWGADMAIIYTLLGDIVDGVNTSKADMGKKCHGQWKRIWY